MPSDPCQLSLSKPAYTAGISLIIMTIISLFVVSSLQADLTSIIGISIIIILDVIVGIAFYNLFKPANKNLALATMISRIIYAIAFAIALAFIFNLGTFHAIWDAALIIFGIHIFFLGLASYKAPYIPKILGVLVMIGSIGYITDSIGKFLGYPLMITMFTFYGEIILAIWLVIKGKNITATITN